MAEITFSDPVMYGGNPYSGYSGNALEVTVSIDDEPRGYLKKEAGIGYGPPTWRFYDLGHYAQSGYFKYYEDAKVWVTQHLLEQDGSLGK